MLDPRYRDFRKFVYLIWKRLGLPDPTWVQYRTAEFLQHGADRTKDPHVAPNNRLFYGAYRGHGKSWIASAFVVWLLAYNQRLNIMVVSGNRDRADDFSTFCFRLLYEIPELAFLLPAASARERWSKIAFDVAGSPASHAPSVKSRSISGMLVGTRADVIIADDVETPQNSDTQHQREKTEKATTEFDNILKPGGRILYLGTYQSEDSIYSRLPDRGFTTWLVPARYPGPDDIEQYQGMLAPFIEDKLGTVLPREPVDPDRFDDITLLEKEQSMGRGQAALQLQLNPTLTDRERYPLRTSDLVVMDLDPFVGPQRVVWGRGEKNRIENLANPGFVGDRLFGPMFVQGGVLPYTGSAMFVDPSGRGADELAACVQKVLNSQIFILELYASTLGYEDSTLEALADVAVRNLVKLVVIEDNFGNGMFTKLFRPFLTRACEAAGASGIGIEEVTNLTNKEKRIIGAMEPAMQQHRVVVNRSVLEYDEKASGSYRFLHQLTRIRPVPRCLPHDDRLECVAQGVQYWVDTMGQDAEERIVSRKRGLIQHELEEFIRKAQGGRAAPTHTFISRNKGVRPHVQRR